MKPDFDVIFMTGPQGSGKGTQDRRLAQRLDFFLWDMGAILREMLRVGGPFAARLAPIDQGMLLDDDVIIDVMKERLPGIPEGKGIIFDGVPRRMGQAQFLLEWLRAHGRSAMIGICIDLPHEESVARLLQREKVEGRPDDTPERIERRLRAFDEESRPMLDYLKTQMRVIDIDGMPPVDEVEREIDVALGI
jgi:adenylate kinase